jgi:phosphoglucosamine mutase
MGRLFGTDGVRGVANADLTPELAFRLGEAAARVLAVDVPRPHFLIGRDTRLSGGMLEGALIAGICSQGVDVRRLGICPTPTIALLTAKSGASGGIMISASHNPFMDNGIKFFAADGFKLTDQVEDQIEALMNESPLGGRPVGAELGSVEDVYAMLDDYVDFACRKVKRIISGFKVVVDCSYGAASDIAPKLWRRLGCDVIELHCKYDGTNINDNCGSTHPAAMCQAVVEHKADFGVAYDGDADRVIMADEQGRVVDGDRILYLCARLLKEEGALKNDTVVATVMSNMGLEIALREHGIKLVKAQVGDRYVLEQMLKHDVILGGEQSGHVIFRAMNTTGDGIITSLEVAQTIAALNQPLSSLVQQVQEVPQKLVNVRVKDKGKMLGNDVIAQAVELAEKELGDQGRVLIRPSGTEQLVRVMVEAVSGDVMERHLTRLVSIVETELA